MSILATEIPLGSVLGQRTARSKQKIFLKFAEKKAKTIEKFTQIRYNNKVFYMGM